MAATVPVASPPTSSSSLFRKFKISLPFPSTPPSPLPSSSDSGSASADEGGNTTVAKSWRGLGTTAPGSPRFKFSKLLLSSRHQVSSHLPQEQLDQNEIQPPASPMQQQNGDRRQHYRPEVHLPSKHQNPTSRSRRSSFFNFLQPHYHIFHRHRGPKDKTNTKPDRHTRNDHSASQESITRSFMSLPDPSSTSTGSGSSNPSSKNSRTAALPEGNANTLSELPDHYMSLPAGGSAFSATNGVYPLHSEDLSMTEFAKLAGITILPEDDDYATASDEPSNSTSDSSAGGNNADMGGTFGLVGHGRESGSISASAGDTMNSERYSTVGSVASSRSRRKTCIWDPQFWAAPSCDSGHHDLTPSASSSSLPIKLVTSSAPASPYRARPLSVPYTPNASKPASLRGDIYSSGSEYGNIEIPFVRYDGHVHEQGDPSPPNGQRTESDKVLGVDQVRTTSSSAPLKRVDQMANPPKDAAELSLNLSRRRSFTSLTAVAIELNNVSAPDQGASESKTNDLQYPQQQQQHPGQRAAPRAIQRETSSDSTGHATRLQRPHNLAHSVALHALQPSRNRSHSTGHNRSNLRAGPSGVARARSPSPSPLSRQVEVSDSEGWDTPQDEKEGFDFQTTEQVEVKNSRPPISRDERYFAIYEDADEKVRSPGSAVWRSPPTQDKLRPPASGNEYVSPIYHHRTQSLPHLLSKFEQQDLNAMVQGSIPRSSSPFRLTLPPPSPSSSHPSTPSCPPNFSPTRVFAPGTKVGRFTLVQETCTEHANVLKAQRGYQEHQDQLAQRRASTGGLRCYNAKQEVEAGVLEGSAVEERLAANPALLNPEENVVVFQRKRTKRLQYPPASAAAGDAGADADKEG
ncbi:hypothetical protein BGZ54_010233 [Gamsiella multidivaricata]|nr:hypothetical protein BGZ54_010233 [Gamsiella multidivaricata]